MEITTTRNCKNGKLLLLVMNSHQCIPRERRMGAESEAAETTLGITVLLREFRCGWSVNGRRRAPPAAIFARSGAEGKLAVARSSEEIRRRRRRCPA